jgi:hypothetical protein
VRHAQRGQDGAGGAGANDVAATSLLRHGNFDYVTNATAWSPSIPSHALPASLYLRVKPAKDRSDHLP